jgi:uncharacterized membrane protein YphA (DoxX/SURF4 family)
MSKFANIGTWIIQVAAAILFIMMGGQKLIGMEEAVANFAKWGYPGFMVYLIGFFELLGAIGLLIPRFAGLAAVGLIMILMGAAFTHLSHGEYDMAPVPIVLIILLAVVAYVRGPFTAFKGAGSA